MWGKLGNWSLKELFVMGMVSLCSIAALALFIEAVDLIRTPAASPRVLRDIIAGTVFVGAVVLLKRIHRTKPDN